jgi:hypothetical protein
MKSGHGRWPFSMVQFLKKTIHKAFGTPLGVNLECEPRGMTMHQKMNVPNFIDICPKEQF